MILVGTASWTDKTLIDAGTFYPRKSMSAEARLRFYAERFPIVELDSSYYALPSEENAKLWVERTPADFLFDVKAFRLLTHHHTAPAALPKDLQQALGPIAKKNLYYEETPEEIREEVWQRFRAGIEPLRAAGKLGLVLFQSPPWVYYSKRIFDYLFLCQERLPGLALAVEFRHQSWFQAQHRDKTLAFERERGLVHVVVDEPQGFSNSIPPIWEATGERDAYVRFHGRNAATWNAKGLSSSAERFDYLYPQAEIAELAAAVKALTQKVQRVHALFNTNRGDQGVVNARRLVETMQTIG